MFQTKVVDKIKTHFPTKNHAICDNVEKYGGGGQSTDDNVICCMPDN